MESYFLIILLCGLVSAVLTVPHPTEVLEPVNQQLEEDVNSAEQYMNAMEERAKVWWESIAGFDYSSEVYDGTTSLEDYLLPDDTDVTQHLTTR
ncbi:Hypothetical predicted protein [Drosophila guanche]|uniref:Uncharacterized protein n=1 Tax=Drosophila guanche TaxID=7266 RepID=A0A3B0JNX2_DROGU|nr:Hypothetical predicted protein [Drosophila guanche]